MDIHRLSLSDVVRRVKSGECTARQVTEAMLARIDALDPQLGAYVLVQGEEALARADALDAAHRRGEPPGPLHGAPIALKDLLCTKGVATTCGTRVLADWRPEQDAAVVERLTAAGAVVLGKVKLTEGAYGEHHPEVSPPKNPWNAERWTGVSSSGSGVAVAAGLAHGAIGTDTGGSIRFPSAACGLVGVKPTYGRVSRFGVFPLAESLDHAGPMTRAVEDAARMLAVMAGHDPRDATSLAAPVRNYAAAFRERLDGVRVAVDWDYVAAGEDIVRDALAVMEGLGAEAVAVTMPRDLDALIDGWTITCGVECARAHQATYPSRKDEYGPALSALIETGLGASRDDYDRLQRLRGSFRSDLDILLASVDALIAPCIPGPVPRAERAPDRERERAERFIRFTAPFDYSGHPAITLPLDVDADGVQRAFQLVGRRLDESSLFRLASAFEGAAGFEYRTLGA